MSPIVASTTLNEVCACGAAVSRIAPKNAATTNLEAGPSGPAWFVMEAGASAPAWCRA
jgi:hypothetical protein